MPKYQSGKSLDALVQKGITGIKNGEYTSIRDASQKLGISRSTLAHRQNGRQSRAVSHQSSQNLSEAEEDALAKWISTSTVTGIPPSYVMIRQIAEHIRHHRVANVNDAFIEHVSYPPLGKHWVSNFMKRHPQFKATYARRIEAARLEQSTEENVKKWLDAVSSTLQDNDIRPCNVYNMDETGFNIGAMQAGRVVVDMTRNVNYKKHPGRQEWVTVVESICADGTVIPPLVIFKGEKLSVNQIPTHVDDEWRFSCSNEGWTNDELALEWLRRCFEPATREKAANEPRLLLLDGHGSHIKSEFLYHAFHNNIIILRLLPHTSHILQPLDVGVFGPLKTYLAQELDNLVRADVKRVSKLEWTEGYARARVRAFKSENILGAWRGAGLFPLNYQKVLRQLPQLPQRQVIVVEPSTPNTNIFNTSLISSSPPDTETLQTSNVALKQVLGTRNPLNTPARNYIVRLAKTTEQLRAHVSILEKEKMDLKAVVKIRREVKKGIQVTLKDQIVMTRPELMERVALIQQERKSKRTKRVRFGKNLVENCSEVNKGDEDGVDVVIPKRRRMVLHAVVV
jgi:DDE superfamily endonuclease/Tc5 transposase DNA-binding domain